VGTINLTTLASNQPFELDFAPASPANYLNQAGEMWINCKASKSSALFSIDAIRMTTDQVTVTAKSF